MARTKQIAPRLMSPEPKSERDKELAFIPPHYSWDRFFSRWKSQITPDTDENEPSWKENGSSFREYWERGELLDDLNKKNSRLAYPQRYEALGVGCGLRRLQREAAFYARHLNQVVQLNAALDQALHSTHEAIKSVRGAGRGTLFQPMFERFAKSLEGIEKDFADNYWAVGYRGASLHPLPSALLSPSIEQERNLDTLFRLRAGWAIRTLDPRLTLQNVAQLIILTYIAASLVEIRGDHLTVLGSSPPRKLSAGAIFDTLSEGGLAKLHIIDSAPYVWCEPPISLVVVVDSGELNHAEAFRPAAGKP